jgi:hypothetical protein
MRTIRQSKSAALGMDGDIVIFDVLGGRTRRPGSMGAG